MNKQTSPHAGTELIVLFIFLVGYLTLLKDDINQLVGIADLQVNTPLLAWLCSITFTVIFSLSGKAIVMKIIRKRNTK